MKPIYEYTDYRVFLKDLYSCKKAEQPILSHRYMAAKIGFKSTGYFTQITKGLTNISLKMAHRFAEFFELNKKDAQYFESLVLFNQAQSHAEKKLYYEKMISFKETSVKALDSEHYEYFSKWYNVAIREILNFYRFVGNYEELAKMVQPSISPEQAREAVAILEKLGMVEKNEDGSYSLKNKLVSLHYPQSPAVGNYYLNSLELAKKALDTGDKKERELSTVTMSISEEGYAAITEELKECRRRIMELAEKYQGPNRAYQFGFHVFPISKPLPKEKA